MYSILNINADILALVVCDTAKYNPPRLIQLVRFLPDVNDCYLIYVHPLYIQIQTNTLMI